MRISFFAWSIIIQSAAAVVTIDGAKRCNANVPPIDFLVLQGDANAEAIEDEVRTDLEKLGFRVKSRFLRKNEYNQARLKGEFGLSFSETWGTPYDPHSYVSAWEAEDNANHNALAGLEAPSSRDELLALVEASQGLMFLFDVLQEEEKLVRQAKWNKVHEYYHAQAMMLPLWGRRVVAIINSRLSGYQAGHQQFDFPVHKLVPVSGSKTVTISPGALTGRFETVGNLDPHTYNPNEFFANNWVYEGLVSYGPEGEILPSLAKSWQIEDTSGGGMKYTFQLRDGVTFHDGTSWTCGAAKLNLDHVLTEVLREPVWHGWYGVPKYIKDWECIDQHFAEGPTSDPYTHNSCERGWGTLGETVGVPKVICRGIRNVSGTGPFAFASREQSVLTTADFEELRVDDTVTFTANQDYWGGSPAIETLKVLRFSSADEIKKALLNGDLDVIWGDGVLPSNDITEFDRMDDPNLNVFIGEDIQNVVLLLNTGTPPLDDIRIRKAIIHSIDKKLLVKKELGGFTDPVDNAFPRSMPYCDVDLTPHWDYDLEKAILLSCDSLDESSVSGNGVTVASSESSSNDLALGLGIGLGLVALIAVVVA